MEFQSPCTPALAPGDTHSQFTKTWLDLSFTQSAFDQGKQAFDECQYDQAINSYTQALCALQTHVACTILLHRAAAYEMNHQFEKARQDSKLAMENAEPAHPDAYFSYGSACYLTNQWSAALAAYRQGIDQVPKDAAMHKELVRKHKQLAKEVDQRNQSLARRLPFEVIDNVMSRVSMVDRMQFAQTCRFWNQWLMREYPNMWYIIDGNDLRRPINTTIDWIPQQYVKQVIMNLTPSLTIRYDGEGFDDDERSSMLRYLSNKAHTNDWSNLCLLSGSEVILNTMHKWDHIETLDISNYEDAVLGNILDQCKDSLKKLTLRIKSRGCSTIIQSLADVARICRNLQYLVIEGGFQGLNIAGDMIPPIVNANIRTIFTTVLDSSSTLPLTQLTLSNEIPEDLLAKLLAHCPKLTRLILTHWSGQSLAQVLQLIHTNCPQLRIFVYGNRYRALPDMTTLPCPDDPAPGLRTISISPLRADNRTKTFTELEHLFRRNRNTLLHVGIGDTLLGAYKCRILKLAADQGLPHLQTLFTWKSTDLDEKRLCALLKACPSLESVSLHNEILPNYQTILETLGDIPKLKHLDIQITWEGVPASEENDYLDAWKRGMKSLFRKTTCLHTFAFSAVQDPPEELEAAMAKTIATLVSSSPVRKLDLRWLDLCTPKAFNTLLKYLKNSQVRELIVGVDIEEQSWQPLSFRRVASIPHLEFFKVCNRGKYFDAEDIEEILDEHENPHTLVVWFDSEHSYVNGCKFAGDSRQDEDDPVKRYHIQVKNKDSFRPFRSRLAP